MFQFPTPAARRGLIVPPGPARINSAHPLTNGLVCLIVPGLALGAGFGPIAAISDLVSGTTYVTNSGGGLVGTPSGVGAYDGGTGNGGWYVSNATAAQKPTSNFSLMWFGKATAPGTYGNNFIGTAMGNASSAQACQMGMASGSSTNVRLQYNIGGTATGVVATNAITLGAPPAVWVGTHGQSYDALYTGGKMILNVASTPGAISYTGTDMFSFTGGGNVSYTSGLTGLLGAMWNRQLTPGAAMFLTRNPSILLDYARDRLLAVAKGRTPVGLGLHSFGGMLLV